MNAAPSGWQRLLPIIGWLGAYRRTNLAGDGLAAVIVTIMLVPQSLAYAMLAGLPPEAGLYASILPLIAYALFGTSRTLAVGPVAVVSLLTANALGDMAAPGSAEYVGYALTLAVLSGLVLIAMGLLRLGLLSNFLSHPVIAAFISASAILIALGQMRHILGIAIERAPTAWATAEALLTSLGRTNAVTALIGFASIVVLVVMHQPLKATLLRLGASTLWADIAGRTGPVVAIVLFTALTAGLDLAPQFDLAIVGAVPAGLPPLTLPSLDAGLIADLLPSAVLISLIGFVESISVARSLGARRRQKVAPDKELIGLGAANIAAGLSGGFPVTGGFARSVINFAAGAQTQLAAILTAVLVTITALTLPALFHDLPQAVLAATIIVAVLRLVDSRAFLTTWRYSKADFLAMAVTFAGVLGAGVEAGILAGVAASLAVYLWHASRPHIAVVGRVPGTEHFRNIKRHKVETDPQILLIRVDESLNFFNSHALEQGILTAVAEAPELRHVVVICSAVNRIDFSGLDTLETLAEELSDAGLGFHLAEVKGPVMDALARTELLKKLSPPGVFLSTHDAVAYLGQGPAQKSVAASEETATLPEDGD